jgi:hypothetical protein
VLSWRATQSKNSWITFSNPKSWSMLRSYQTSRGSTLESSTIRRTLDGYVVAKT